MYASKEGLYTKSIQEKHDIKNANPANAKVQKRSMSNQYQQTYKLNQNRE